MKRVVSGIVMDIDKNSAVIMTKTGEFVTVEKPSSDMTLGQEITSKTLESKKGFRFKFAAIAAAIMIMLIPFTYFTQAMATVAYVNVDINPSLEIGINKYNNVTDVHPLNDDAKKLVSGAGLKGLNIDDALGRVIQKAGDMGYINDSKENTIEIALIDLNPAKTKVSKEHLIECAQSFVEKLDVDATIKINGANKKDHDAANDKKISTNKYLDQTNNKPEKEVEVKKPSANSGKDNNNKPAVNSSKDNNKKSSVSTSKDNSSKPAKKNDSGNDDKSIKDNTVTDTSSKNSQQKSDESIKKNNSQPVNDDKIPSSGIKQEDSRDKASSPNDSSKDKSENNDKSNSGSNSSQKSDSSLNHSNGKK